MNIMIYKSLIFHSFVLFYDVSTLFVEIKGNKTGILGKNETEIECSYIKEGSEIKAVKFFAFNKTITKFESILYLSEQSSFLTPHGQYLNGRASFVNISQSSTKAGMIVTNLMCVDNTLYQCQVRAFKYGVGDEEKASNTTSISVQVPPLRPDSISLVHIPANFPHTSTKHMIYNTSSPSTAVTSTETETVSASQSAVQNDTNAYHYYTVPKTDPETKSATPSDSDFSPNISNRTTTYSTQQTTTAQGIAEGDNITVVCTGDVGKPPAKHVFEKYLNGQIVPIQDTVNTTSISDMSDNCSYYRTSNLTFKVTADDNKAVIRCVVNSSMTEPNMYVETAPIEVYSDISTTKSSSTFNSSGTDDNNKKKKMDINDPYTAIGIASVGVIVIIIVFLIVIIARKKRTSKSPTYTFESISFVNSKPKPVTASRTGNYDCIALDDDATKTLSDNSGIEVEDISKHNEEYLKKQEEEEQKKNESNTPPQPAVYAQVNEATKSRNKQNTETTGSADKQEEDTYAETQEGIYDKAGDRRHKENENVEHFDSSNNSSKQTKNSDTKLSIKTSQIGSHVNQAFEKDENRKVATVSPTMRSSGGSQDDEQTNQSRNRQSKKENENIIGTDQTGTSEDNSSHQTALYNYK